MAQQTSVTVYTKPACVQCNATYRALDKGGVTYTVIDITQDPAARDFAMSLGHMSAPVVVAGDQHWGGFSPDKVKTLVEKVAAEVAQSAPVLAAA